MPETVWLFIDGNPEKPEILLAERIGVNTFRLLVSPGFVLGMAAGDVISLNENGEHRIIKRGGNLCIQVFARSDIAEIERWTTPSITALAGRLDGLVENGLIVYTVPATAGFPAIERAMRALKERWPDVEWYYGNVYDPKDGITPLNWWVHG